MNIFKSTEFRPSLSDSLRRSMRTIKGNRLYMSRFTFCCSNTHRSLHITVLTPLRLAFGTSEMQRLRCSSMPFCRVIFFLPQTESEFKHFAIVMTTKSKRMDTHTRTRLRLRFRHFHTLSEAKACAATRASTYSHRDWNFPCLPQTLTNTVTSHYIKY